VKRVTRPSEQDVCCFHITSDIHRYVECEFFKCYSLILLAGSLEKYKRSQSHVIEFIKEEYHVTYVSGDTLVAT
jgi:hypothetical protein